MEGIMIMPIFFSVLSASEASEVWTLACTIQHPGTGFTCNRPESIPWYGMLFLCNHTFGEKYTFTLGIRKKTQLLCPHRKRESSMSACSFVSLCIWSNQLYQQSGRTLPADSGLMINWLHPGETQIRGKAEMQLAFIFQRWEWWDFENAF